MESLIVKTDDGYRIPGLVDAHVHVESSHLAPSEFGRMLLYHGTVAAVCDPHEIVNVAGEMGLAFMFYDAAHSPADLYFGIPSSVPATPFETSGSLVTAEDVERIFEDMPQVVALSEVMNVPGVLQGDPEILGKIAAAKKHGKVVDGHFPGGRGAALLKYAAAGIMNDHESYTAEEALEKVAAGMTVFIREGSSAKNLEAIVPVVNDENWEKFCFCADDLSAADLLAHGDILNCIRKAVKLGIDPEKAVAMGSVIPARHYGIQLHDDDYVVVKDLVDFEIVRVVRHGRVVREGMQTELPFAERSSYYFDNAIGTMKIRDLHQTFFPKPPAVATHARVIGVQPSQLVTESLKAPVAELHKLARLMVLERHGVNGNVSFAYADGTGLDRGAIASTIAHDSHNMIVLGKDDADMRFAAEHLVAIGGGATVVLDGKVLADFPLHIGGLLSVSSAEQVAREDAALRRAAKTTGCTLPEPLTTLSFLALPVIPHLKLTDCGLFDVDAFNFTSLYC